MYEVCYQEIAMVNGETKVNSKVVHLLNESSLASLFGSLDCQKVKNFRCYFVCAGHRLLTPIVPDAMAKAGAVA